MHLRKLRDWFVEAKLYYVRTYSYLSIFNFLMICLIFLNTTLWDYSIIQQIFPNRKLFLVAGILIVLLAMFLIGFVDTKLKLWQIESSKILMPNRNPAMIPEAFQCAKMLNELKEKGIDISELDQRMNKLFTLCSLQNEFEFFKQKMQQSNKK